jgi:hypothetical protein
VVGLDWLGIAVGATAPSLAAVLVAWPIWRRHQPILGNLAGAFVIFAAAIALMMREHVQLDAQVQACLDRGVTCWPDPPAFTRYAIYATTALAQVMALFLVSLRVERNLRRRGYDPEWR